MDDKQTIIVLDQNGKEANAEVLSTFEIKELGKKYILFTLNEKDENNMVKMYASRIIERDGMYSFEAIDSDEEWSIIKEVIKKMAQTPEE